MNIRIQTSPIHFNPEWVKSVWIVDDANPLPGLLVSSKNIFLGFRSQKPALPYHCHRPHRPALPWLESDVPHWRRRRGSPPSCVESSGHATAPRARLTIAVQVDSRLHRSRGRSGALAQGVRQCNAVAASPCRSLPRPPPEKNAPPNGLGLEPEPAPLALFFQISIRCLQLSSRSSTPSHL
jgi:hypothetical protein